MPLIRKPSTPVAPPAVDALTAFDALENGTDDERWAAARAVSRMPGGVAALARAIESERDVRVREAMLTSLARTGSPESVEALLPFVRSDDAQLRTGALDALRATNEGVRPYLPQLLRDRDVDVRLLACELARNLPADEASKFLCELLDAESEPNVCAAAVEVLAEVGGPTALPSLARCAERFRGTPFLDYSIELTAERIRLESTRSRE
jgi:HEAT repeat protein